METNQIRLKLKDFRAIKKADIILDGITVVAGENGSGKSTLSKFLYYVFKVSNEYDKQVNKELSRQLDQVRFFLERFSRFLERIHDQTERLNKETDRDRISERPYLEGMFRYRGAKNREEWISYMNFLLSTYSIYAKAFENALLEGKATAKIKELRKELIEKEEIRIISILMDILDATTKPKYLDQTDLSGLLGKLELKIHNYFDNAEKKIKERPVDLLIQSLHNVFSESKLPKEYFILEYGAPIISNKDIRVENAFSVQQLAYMDTPMLLGIDISKYDYWTEVNSIVKRQSNNSFDTQINNIITGNILHGDTEYDLSDKRPNQFIYQREDGTEFNLLDCATGIRSFAILQMMLKNGFLNKYTLLIIDEPESHLHPQWIVEYARLIVLLNKHIGVKFFIASHNPDMVSAIKYISEKEETDENLNFYLAERDKHSFQYNYRGLGTDIEPIFESFNIALERINHYGTKEGE